MPLNRPAPSRVRKALLYLVLPAVLLGGGWVGLEYAKLRLSLAHAHQEFGARQMARAEFWACHALDLDRANLDATRMMAEIYEAQDRPAALGWRMKAVELEPGSTGDVMALAKCALRFGQDDVAAGALKSLPAEFAGRSAEYEEVMAGCALANHDMATAEADFEKAAELERENPLHRVNLAAFRLANSSDANVRAGAAHDMEGMLADGRVSVFVVRALLGDAIRRGDRPSAERYAEKLRAAPEHGFSDDLSYLDATAGEAGFQPAMKEIEHRAEANPMWTAEMGDWLNAHGMAAETLRWTSGLPAANQSNVRVQIMISDAYLKMSHWNGLQTFLAKCQWGDCEFMRRAMVVRSKREMSQPWEDEWKRLVTDVEVNPDDLLLLAQLVTGWNWRSETIGLLWVASTKPKTGAKALLYLWDIYSRSRDTLEMQRVAKAQMDMDPANPVLKNNYAFLSLLLFGASENAERLAEEASSANPKSAEWAATYAYALELAGKKVKAKKVMEKLPAEVLTRPGVALYYAIVLAGNGDNGRAREVMGKLNENGMLPEERKLAEEVRGKL